MPTLFRERLTPGPLVLLVAAVFGAMFGVILVPISHITAIAVAVLMALALPAALIASSPVVEVRAESIVAGKAHIAPEFVGEATVLDREAFAAVMGPDMRAADFRVTRGWIATGAELPIIDPKDPTPAWVISLRHPEDFALAVQAARRSA